jgi:type IV pilus assembly protein PilV
MPIIMNHYNPTRQSAGFTLVEVLISLIISAFGLLGIAGMQMFSINTTSASNVRAVAAIEASNLISYMKANPAYWESVGDEFAISLETDDDGNIGIEDIDNTTDYSGYMLNGLDANCTTDDACDSADKVAAYNLRQWKAKLDTRLPNAEVSIKRIRPADIVRFPLFSITISWQEKVSAQNLKMKGSYYNSSNEDNDLANSVRTLSYRIAVQP